jgi:CheY-specific phosphatase CheX
MMQQMGCFKTVAAALADRTRSYLAAQAGIEVTGAHVATDDVDQLKLRHATAVIGVGGSIGMLIAFSLSRSLVDALYERLTAGFDIRPEQEADFRAAVVTEIANVIIGNCTEDFADEGERVSLSPPVLLEDSKSIHRMKNARFGTVMMETRHGPFDIHMIGPRNMFDAQLNYETMRNNHATA